MTLTTALVSVVVFCLLVMAFASGMWVMLLVIARACRNVLHQAQAEAARQREAAERIEPMPTRSVYAAYFPTKES